MVDTAVIATVGGSLVVFGALTALLVAIFRSVERDAYQTTARRKLARSSFGIGAFLWLGAMTGLATSFVVESGPLPGVDPLFPGVGAVVVASIPLAAGLVLAMDGNEFEG